MIKKLVFSFAFLILFQPFNLKAQQNISAESFSTQKDTICFTVDKANQIRNRIETLEFRDSLNTKIIKTQRNQIEDLNEKIKSLEREIKLTERSFELYKKRKELEESTGKETKDTKRWFYTAGGAILGFLAKFIF